MTHPIEQYTPTIPDTAPKAEREYVHIKCRWPGHGLPRKGKKG